MSVEGLMLDLGMDVDVSARERKMYGMSVKDIDAQYVNSITARLSGLEMVVMGMLSDVQHMQEYNFNKEDIRQMLNRAKYILCVMQDQKEAK